MPLDWPYDMASLGRLLLTRLTITLFMLLHP